jgi:hypothetical protein
VTVNSSAMLTGTSVVGAITINPVDIFTPGATGTPDTPTVARKPGPIAAAC